MFLQSNGIKTPFGDVTKYNSSVGDEKRSHFSRKVFINHVQLQCTPLRLLMLLLQG